MFDFSRMATTSALWIGPLGVVLMSANALLRGAKSIGPETKLVSYQLKLTGWSEPIAGKPKEPRA